MNTHKPSIPVRRRALQGTAVAALLLALGACTSTGSTNTAEGIGFREARFEEISAMQDYRKCRDDALELDTQAHATGNPGRYLASARLIENCEAELGPEANGVGADERMRAYALSIQNYLKGGDVAKASENFDRFQQAFPGKDLYYYDGSSFIETMSALLGQQKDTDFGQFAVLNVNETLKGEMRRSRYWTKN